MSTNPDQQSADVYQSRPTTFDKLEQQNRGIFANVPTD
jgi:hypothetical protein